MKVDSHYRGASSAPSVYQKKTPVDNKVGLGHSSFSFGVSRSSQIRLPRRRDSLSLTCDQEYHIPDGCPIKSYWGVSVAQRLKKQMKSW